jgi:tubulin delta
MSVITVNAGQCGNQLGFDLFNTLYENVAKDPEDLNCFFRRQKNGKPIVRSVCLDTEPKVILNCVNRANKRSWSYDSDRCTFRHGGAGNNWALGYQMCSGSFLETALNNIRSV